MTASLVAAFVWTAVGQVTAADGLKPFREVIPEAATRQSGLFNVHEHKGKTWFEVPTASLGKDMIWQSQQVEIPHPLGSPGPDKLRLVRWQRRGNTIELQAIDTTLTTPDAGGLRRAVDAVLPPSVIAVFPVLAEGQGQTAVIDVTDFLLTDHGDLNLGMSWNASFQRSKSYTEFVKAYPENIEVRNFMSFTMQRVETIPGTNAGYTPMLGPNASMRMHYSFYKLPEDKMMPRLRDPRVGFFSEVQRSFGGPHHGVQTREVIKRFRLEKKNPTLPISEPVKPITFWISREVPEKWRPAIVNALEAWEPAFERAGFRNALEARVEPTKEEDPNFVLEDFRHSTVRWLAKNYQNAFGLSQSDPRTGEIISSHVVIFHDFLTWLQNLYFAQVSSMDPRARQLPFKDDLMAELLQYIVTHEFGHTLGLEHNFKSSYPYSIANLRNPEFVRQHDIAASIMDYARFNYVAQPGDGVPLRRGISEYDQFAIAWGYRPVPAAQTPEQELPTLRALAAQQNANPFVRFANYAYPEDPSTMGDDLSNDPIAAARLGRANLARSASALPAAIRNAEDPLLQMRETLTMFNYAHDRMMEAVMNLVGGVYVADHLQLTGQPIFTPVPKARQRAAVRFVCGPEGRPPAEMFGREITDRLFSGDDVARRVDIQAVLVSLLMFDGRVRRLVSHPIRYGTAAYSLEEMVDDMIGTLWRATSDRSPVIDAYDRQLQRSILALMDRRINGPEAHRTELAAVGRSALRQLASRIDAALPRTKDRMTAIQLADNRKTIERIMNGTSSIAVGTPPPPAVRLTGRELGCGWGHSHGASRGEGL